MFALGSGPYEMVTGRRAFGGKSQVSLIPTIRENLHFEELLADRAYELLFVFTPVRFKGATGSPGRPILGRDARPAAPRPCDAPPWRAAPADRMPANLETPE